MLSSMSAKLGPPLQERTMVPRANHDHVFGVTERWNISPEDLADISQQPTAADTPEIDAPSVNISLLHNSQAHRHRHA